MNPFQQHAENMKAYEQILAEPLTANDQVNSVDYRGRNIVATVGPFMEQQVLKADGGGFQRVLMAEVIIQKTAVPAATDFKTGQWITVNQLGGTSRKCRVDSVQDTYTEFRVNVIDASQGA